MVQTHQVRYGPEGHQVQPVCDSSPRHLVSVPTLAIQFASESCHDVERHSDAAQ